jgi:DNA mismatch repair ATPase MutS
MSGKSTFLRTIGVNVVLAQTIATSLASRHEAPVFSVRSCIGRSDDLVGGKSYYLAEVEALLGLVQAGAASEPCLFLLDEMFRGTNASERIAAGEAVLRELVVDPSGQKKAHVALAATHDGELVDLLAGTYDAMHFGDAVGAEGLVFDHRLRQGPATTRNAIALLRLSGAPASLVERATASADRLDRERGVLLTRR